MNSEKKGFFRYENFIMIAMFVAYGLPFMDRFGLAMLFPMIAPEMKLSDTQLGLTMSSLALAWGVSSYLFPTLSDIIGSKKKILIGAIIVFSFATMGTGLAQTFGFLIAMRAIMGIAEGPTPVLAQVTMVAASSPNRKGFNMGFVQSASSLMGTAVGSIIVLGAAQYFGWRGALNVLAAPGLVLAVILIIFMKEPIMASDGAQKKRPGRSEYAQIFKNRNVWLGIIMAFGMMSWWLTQTTFFSLYFTEINHFTPAQIASIYSIYGVVCFLSAVLVPMVSDKIGRKPACIISSFFVLIGSIAVASVHSYSLLVTLMTVLFLLGAGTAPLYISVIPSESVPKELVATAIGLIVMTGELLGGTLVPAFAGFVSDQVGIQVVMWLAAAGAVIQFIPSLFIKETLPSKLKKKETL